MRKFYALTISLIVALVPVCSRAQQLPVFTNYLLNDYAYNPAVAGAKPYTSINLNYRNQWTGFADAPKTAFISAYGGLGQEKKVALGGMVISDQTGLLTKTNEYVTLAYHVKLSDTYKLGFGVSAGMVQYRIRLYDAKVADAGDDLLTGNLLSNNAFDSNAGLYFYSDRLSVGISGYQFLNNKITWVNSQSFLSPHYYLTAAYMIHCNEKFWLQPSVLVKYNEPTPVQPEFSLRGFYQNTLWVGASYRLKEGASALIGYKLKERLVIGYAYDFPLNQLRSYTSGSHEIQLSYNFVKKKRKLNSDEEEFNNIDNSIKNKTKTN